MVVLGKSRNCVDTSHYLHSPGAIMDPVGLNTRAERHVTAFYEHTVSHTHTHTHTQTHTHTHTHTHHCKTNTGFQNTGRQTHILPGYKNKRTRHADVLSITGRDLSARATSRVDIQLRGR